MDKDLPLNEIAREEILEETGYDVKASDLERVTSMRFVLIFKKHKMRLSFEIFLLLWLLCFQEWSGHCRIDSDRVLRRGD